MLLSTVLNSHRSLPGRLKKRSQDTDKPDACDAPAVVHELRFENVQFEYRESRPVVRDINVVVPSGSVVALVGRRGAGKNTVTDLVARFHDPTQGRILLNGIDIRDFCLAIYRDLLAIVQHDVFLFDGSVRDNIAYERGRHEELMQARGAYYGMVLRHMESSGHDGEGI